MEAKMFCYQCQETMKGTGCILKGVCGKESHTAKAMDLLMFVVRGISVVTDEFRNAGHPVAAEVNRLLWMPYSAPLQMPTSMMKAF